MTWIDDDARFAAVVDELVEVEAYALDTEFHRERTYFPQLALLQLAWPGGSVLVDPLAVDLTPLAKVFAGPAVAVIHAASQDLEVLELACGSVPGVLFDTQVAAGFVGFSTPSLAQLLERLLKVQLPKADRLTDWLRRPLGHEAKVYAAGDVDPPARAARHPRRQARGPGPARVGGHRVRPAAPQEPGRSQPGAGLDAHQGGAVAQRPCRRRGAHRRGLA